MKRALRTLGYLVIVFLLAGATLIGVAWSRSEAALAEVHRARPAQLAIVRAPEALERGRHLAMTRGCTDCHGEDLAGLMLTDAQPMGRLYGANLTLLGKVDAAQLERAIRQGLAADGRSLTLMPTIDYAGLSDTDIAALIAHLQSLPPVGLPTPVKAPGLLPRLLWLFDQFPLISHAQVAGRKIARQEYTPAVTVEYGGYVAQVCQGCHNPAFSGGPMIGAPPEAPVPGNLTPDISGLLAWNEQQFIAAMPTGVRPDGRSLDRFMPWMTFSRMSDLELRALWLYLQSLPARPTGARS